MSSDTSPEKGPNELITFQCQGELNEFLRDTAWSERKSLSQLIRELCRQALQERFSENEKPQSKS